MARPVLGPTDPVKGGASPAPTGSVKTKRAFGGFVRVIHVAALNISSVIEICGVAAIFIKSTRPGSISAPPG